jgi:hypothetical protein
MSVEKKGFAMKSIKLVLIILLLSIPASAGWDAGLKEVAIEGMGMSLMLPEDWSVTPDVDEEFSKLDKKMLCTPVIIEDDIAAFTIYIYASERDDFTYTVFDMFRMGVTDEGAIIEIANDIDTPVYDADGAEYAALRTMNVVGDGSLAYGVMFHRGGTRYEFYYTPNMTIEYGEHYARFAEVLETIRFE